ncbi:MAG: hypothetical protein ACK55I_32280, partial [bacterium]
MNVPGDHAKTYILIPKVQCSPIVAGQLSSEADSKILFFYVFKPDGSRVLFNCAANCTDCAYNIDVHLHDTCRPHLHQGQSFVLSR